MNYTRSRRRIALFLLLLLLTFTSAGCARMTWIPDPVVSDTSGTETSSERPMPSLSVKGDETSEPSEPTQEQLERWIKLAFLKKYASPTEFSADALSVRFIGTFDGFYAVFVDGYFLYVDVYQTENLDIGDRVLDFRYPTTQTMLLYRGSALYDLAEASTLGIFSAEELQEVYNAYREVYWELYAEGENAALTAEIYAAYWKKYGESLASVEYLALIDDWCAVSVFTFSDRLLSTPQYVTETVNGLEFRLGMRYNSPYPLLLYRAGMLCSLEEALRIGWLSREELQILYDTYRASVPYLYMEGLPEPAAVKEAFLERYDVSPADGSADDLTVRYVAQTGDICAVFVDGIFDYLQVEVTETVNGLEFQFPDSQPLLLFRDGALYTLQEAFDSGLLNAIELQEIHDIYCTTGPRFPVYEDILYAEAY